MTGHGFCESCTDQLFPTLENITRCPNCRKSIRQGDGHPVYLELVDSKWAVPTVENQKQEIEALREELHRSHQERDSIQTEVDSLRTALSESEANTQEAIRLAEVAENDLGKVHETSGQWQRRATELDEQNKHVKDMLELHASIVSPTELFISTEFM